MMKLKSNRPALRIAASLAVFLLWTPAAIAEAPAAAGHWEGEIAVPGSPLVIRVDLAYVEGAWTGTIDIPPQGAVGLPLADLVIEDTTVRFRIEGVPGEPTFDGKLEGEEIRGQFSQGGAQLGFRLGREALEGPRRPQTPEPPFPYRSEEVGYENGDVHLAATLTLPEGDGPFPAMVLITGSGPQDRNASLFGHQSFLVIADHLTRAGIAVLRADDRGVGESTGDIDAATTSDFAADALAGVRYLASRPEIDGQRIGLLGHSEGGLVAPLAAARSDKVALVVLLAGPAVSGAEIILHQSQLIDIAEGSTPEVAEKRAALMRVALDWLSVEQDPERLRQRLVAIAQRQMAMGSAAEQQAATQSEVVEKTIERLLTPWLRFFLTYDPASALRLVKVPVLAVNGELDLQVDPQQNLPVIAAALEQGGNPDATTRVVPGLNHLFQHTETGKPSEYGEIEETFAPEVLDLVTSWLRERFTTGNESGGAR